MNGNKDLRLFVRKTQKRSIISGLIVGIILTNFCSSSIGFGFLSGVAVSIINFQLMSVDAYNLEGKTPKKARKFYFGRSLLRFTIMFGFLALVATRTQLDIIASFIGIFFVKAVLIAGQIIEGLNFVAKTSGSKK